MEARHQLLIKEKMPIFLDPVCSVCPVVGLCWGQCVDAHSVINNKPSNFCDPKALSAKIKELALSGELCLSSSSAMKIRRPDD